MRLPLTSTDSGRRPDVAPRPRSRANFEDPSLFAHDDSPMLCGLGFGNFGGCFIPPYRPKTNTKRPCNSKTTESFLDDDDDDDDCERKESLLQKPNSMSRSLLLKPLLRRLAERWRSRMSPDRSEFRCTSNRCGINPKYPEYDNHEHEYKPDPYPFVCKKCHDDNPPYPYPDPDPYPYPYPDPNPYPDDDDEPYIPYPIPSIPLKPSGPIISPDWPPFIPFIPPFVPEYTARPKPSVVPIPLKPLKPYKSNEPEPDPDLEPFSPFLPPFIERPKPQPAHLIPPISPIIRIPLEQVIDQDSQPSRPVKGQTSRPKPLIPILPSRATISDSPLEHDRSIVKTSSLRSITSGGSSLDPPPFNDDYGHHSS